MATYEYACHKCHLLIERDFPFGKHVDELPIIEPFDHRQEDLVLCRASHATDQKLFIMPELRK